MENKNNKGRRIAEQKIKEIIASREQRLDLHGLGLSILPESLKELKWITYLKIEQNNLTSLPDWIDCLQELEVLKVWDNKLETLPSSIVNIPKLFKLDISRNHLKFLPESIGNLNNLQNLILWKNNLCALPLSICNLVHLKIFDISNNKLVELPEVFKNMVELETFATWGNQLEALPESINSLSNLIILNISNNRIKSLPKYFSGLKKLQQLITWGNQIETFPADIGSLKDLELIDASKNQIVELPESIGNLDKLLALVIWDNCLKILPSSLQRLRSLRKLLLHGNNELKIPPEILGPMWYEIDKGAAPANPARIIHYYLCIQGQGNARPLNEAKLILVGRGGVGKSSLVNRLLNKKFDDSMPQTQGIDIRNWEIELKEWEKVRLNIWDFGGQEIMHATHQFFLTERTLYLLVLEGRQGAEDADAEYWLKLIESFGTEKGGEVSPVIVVLNKIIAYPFDLNRPALKQKYPFIRDFIETDCKDDIGILDLRILIEQETDQLKHLRDLFPNSWFEIRNKLATMKESLGKNYITFDEYRHICSRNSVDNMEDQEKLAFYLNSLGIALNYKDDPRLKENHILNPQWVTNGIYKILNSQLLRQNKGEVKLADVAQILDIKEYPLKIHCFLFDLMKKFELCFSFPDDDTRYLIPELLDKQEPVEASSFLTEDCLFFEYRYPILPEGLLPRFIVRTHYHSSGLARWRTGVILSFEGNKALVKADVHEKRIFISINGEWAGRRKLLAIIRSDFERIHATISKLKPIAFVPVPGYEGFSVPYEELRLLEKTNVKSNIKVWEDKIIEINIEKLLNGVDIAGPDQRMKTFKNTKKVPLVFYSYSHKDEDYKNALEAHLRILAKKGLISEWHDRKIEAGDDYRAKIDENMQNADLIIMLVSADFLASDFIWDEEMKFAVEKAEKGEVKLIPIIIRAVNWRGAPFAKFEVLPRDGKAVMEWENPDAAWRNVSEGIQKIVES